MTKQVVEGADINEVLHEIPLFNKYIYSLYNAQYADFFVALGELKSVIKGDRLQTSQTHFYVREMPVISYVQSYTRMLTVLSLLTIWLTASKFRRSSLKGLRRFISAGALNAKIDMVGGIIQTNRPDQENWQYQAVIKQRDLLLNRIQKLSQVMVIGLNADSGLNANTD